MLSDPHGDAAAMGRGIAALGSVGVSAIWCLGDLVGDDGADETVRLAVKHCEVVIAGNHDLVVAGRLASEYVASHDRAGSIERIRASLSSETRASLGAFPTQHLGSELQAAHAALDHWTDHVDDEWDASNQLALADARFLALGHSHRAFCYLADGRWLVEPRGTIDLTVEALISPGSVRATNDREATVCVLDTAAETCDWLTISSD